MQTEHRAFLERLLDAPGPSGYEAACQRVWVDHVSEFADDVRTDAYGNAVAVYRGDAGPEVAFAGHADEIGLIVTEVDDRGFLRVAPIGGTDRTVTKGQHVAVHADAGPIPGVVGQTPIHLRDADDEDEDDITDQFVDVGAADADEARDLVDVGDPVTFTAPLRDLAGGRLAAPGMDNRTGVWAAAEGLRRAAENDVDATVYAVSTVQEELGLRGARMIGFDLDPDAVLAVDVTHAADSPAFPGDRHAEVELGGGPVVTRGSANHPEVVAEARRAGADAGVDVQLAAAGTRTGTDADGFYTERGGIPAATVGVPNRYMHTPAEVVDASDLDAVANLLAAFADGVAGRDGFAVQM